MCRVLEVSRSTYYARKGRVPSAREVENEQLAQEIQKIHERSMKTYGSPRIHRELQDQGNRVGRHRVARIMRENAICGRVRRRFRKTTNSDHGHNVADNLLRREFTVDSPNKVWAADLTYLWTEQGWAFLAVILDLYSRRVVGWSLQNHMQTGLTLSALQMALGQREVSRELVHHSDRGTQYASAEYQRLLSKHGVTCSMSRRGDCWDNAVVESFFGTLKQELIYTRRWRTRRELKDAVHDYIELFYNRTRRHSTLGYVSPAKFEESVA